MFDEEKKKEQEEADEIIEEAHQRDIELTCENCNIKYTVADSSDCPECGYDNFEQMEDAIA